MCGCAVSTQLVPLFFVLPSPGKSCTSSPSPFLKPFVTRCQPTELCRLKQEPPLEPRAHRRSYVAHWARPGTSLGDCGVWHSHQWHWDSVWPQNVNSTGLLRPPDKICTLMRTMLRTRSITASHRGRPSRTAQDPQPRTLDGPGAQAGEEGDAETSFSRRGHTCRKQAITGTNSPLVRLWEVRAVAVSAPMGEVVKFVFQEKLFLPLASAALVCRVKFSGASEEVWFFVGI